MNQSPLCRLKVIINTSNLHPSRGGVQYIFFNLAGCKSLIDQYRTIVFETLRPDHKKQWSSSLCLSEKLFLDPDMVLQKFLLLWDFYTEIFFVGTPDNDNVDLVLQPLPPRGQTNQESTWTLQKSHSLLMLAMCPLVAHRLRMLPGQVLPNFLTQRLWDNVR